MAFIAFRGMVLGQRERQGCALCGTLYGVRSWVNPLSLTLRRYEFLAAGAVPARCVTMDYRPEARLPLDAEQRRAMDSRWERLKATGRRLEDRPLYRFLGFTATDDGLHLTLGHTTYREFEGTNGVLEQWVARYGAGSLSDPIGLCAAAITADGTVITGLRSAQVASWPEMYSLVPAGNPHPPASLRESLLAELKEETAVCPDELAAEPVCTGLVLDHIKHRVDVTFLLSLALRWHEVCSRRPEDAWEHRSIEPLPWQPQPVSRFLLEREERVTPPSHGCLALAGRLGFGEGWFEGVTQALRPLAS